MQPFNVKAFQQRVQQTRTPDDYEQLKQELSEYFKSLSAAEKTKLQQDFKTVWTELNNRIDTLINEAQELNRRVTA